MSRVSKFISLAAIAFAAISCGSNSDEKASPKNATQYGVSKVECTLEPSSQVVFGWVDRQHSVILDTLKTDGAGKIVYELSVAEGDPEFVYVYSADQRIASLLVEAGDQISIKVNDADSTTIEGSKESVRLTELDKEHEQRSAKFAELAQKEMYADMTKEYTSYYRTAVKYVMENSHSLTTVPMLYRALGDLPLFAMDTDAILFKNIADSLLMTYPKSRYAQALKEDAQARFNAIELRARVAEAPEIGYFDIELSGLDGKKKKLSDLDSKVILLYFWSAADPAQNVFNVNVLKNLYNDYHHKGFDIYQVSLDTDKVLWATTIMGQELPWTNVNDMLGAASPYVLQYNLQTLPSAFVINNGELVDGEIVDEASFRKLLNNLLK